MSALDGLRAALREHDDHERGDLGIDMQSQLLDHGAPTATTTLLLHGLTASPRQYDRFARELHARGHTVVVPRVVRHGHEDRMTRTLADLSSEELRAFADRMYASVATLGGDLSVLGFSLGGALALWIAQRHPVRQAVAVAPFLGIALVPHELHGTIRRVVRTIPNQFVFWNPIERERQQPAHGYPRYATRALGASLELADELRLMASCAGPAARRVDVVLNASETSVNNRTARHLVDAWETVGFTEARIHRLSGLPPSHDVIEPLARNSLADRVYPVLLTLVA